MNLLALDISTAIIGWSIFEDKNLIKYGKVDLTKLDRDPFLKLDEAITQVSKIIVDNNVEHVVAEAALQRISGGKSSAHVINLLIAFNFSLSYLCRTRCSVKVSHISVATARALTGIKFPKKSKSKDKKELIRAYVADLYPFILWEKKKTGTYKDWCYDCSDSIIIGRCFLEQGTETKADKTSVSKSLRKKAAKQK